MNDEENRVRTLEVIARWKEITGICQEWDTIRKFCDMPPATAEEQRGLIDCVYSLREKVK